MVASDRFHQESGVLAAYEGAEAALWRNLDRMNGLTRRTGESRAETVQRIARAVADAVIRSDPDEFYETPEDITTVPGITRESGNVVEAVS